MNKLIQEILDCEYDFEECYYLVKKWKAILKKQMENKKK